MPQGTALDQLAHVLHPATFPPAQCAQALRQAGNDVAGAAELLLLGAVRVKTPQPRSWFKPKVKQDTEIVCIDDSDESDHEKPSRKEQPDLNSHSAKRRKTMHPAEFMARLTANQDKAATSTRKPGERPVLLKSTFSAHESMLEYPQVPTLTLHRSPIPPALASALFLELMGEADGFERHEWFLAGRKVQSPHTSGYYHSGELEREDVHGKGEYWYAGRKVQPAPRFPPLLQEAANIITPFVNDVLSRRTRHRGEYAGPWQASYAAVNHYQGAGSSVGWHADQSTYLGPCATIVSLSLGTPREFRLRPMPDPSATATDILGHPIRTYALTLAHNSLCIMHAGTQELYKHTVPAHTNGSLDLFHPPYDRQQRWLRPEQRGEGWVSRVNVTFRFYRPDFRPYPGLGPAGRKRDGTPVCRCGFPTILRADQKGKARASLAAQCTPPAPETAPQDPLARALDGMIYFWQCQSSSVTGSERGCGFFKVLDFVGEGRGPCVGDAGGKG